MKLVDGAYTRKTIDPPGVPDEPFTVIAGGEELLWCDGRSYYWDGEQYETDPGGNAVIFENGEFLEVHTTPPAYGKGTYGIPGVV